LPIVLNFPWHEFPGGNYKCISLHRKNGRDSSRGIIGTTEFQHGREIPRYSPPLSPYDDDERPATIGEIWLFTQVARFLGGDEDDLILPTNRLNMLNMILAQAQSELIQRRDLIDRYLSQIRG